MNIRAALLPTLALALAACAQGGASDAPIPAANAAPLTDAVPPPAEVVPPGDPRIELAAKMPGTRPEDLRASPVPGVYELVHGGEVSYVSADGAYVFTGDLYQVTADGEFPNLTEGRRREARRALMASVPAGEMIEFGKADSRYTISVFTDVDCQWCRRMHSEVAEYNKLGIRVRYLSYPRTGPDTESWEKAVNVWCASDRNAALTEAKQGNEVRSARCDAPIDAHYQLGREIGITGTPGVLLPTGEVIPGYLPPQRMLTALRQSEAEAAAALAAK
mgnify:CR=1 FL=1|jgi:thiol:disulfide interchange protein DsbC